MRKYLSNNNRRGVALVLVIVVMTVLIVLGSVVLRIAVAENNFAVRHENKLQAYYLARSGALSVAEYMVRDAENDAHELVDETSEWNEQIGDGKFRVETKNVPSSSDIDIISTGEYRGIQQQAKIRITGSSTGIGSILQYAVAAVNDISVGDNGNKLEIEGSIATKYGVINLDKGTSGPQITDSNLNFPPIELPPDRSPAVAYDLNLGKLNLQQGSSAPIVNTTSSNPTYIYTKGITIKNNALKITGNGVAHLYVDEGNLIIDTNGEFDVASTAKLYVYVVGNKTVKFIGRGSLNNVFIYAPDSHVEWNNSKAGDVIGSIIGKTVELFGGTKIKYNPDMANDVELDITGSGVTYSGYVWMD